MRSTEDLIDSLASEAKPAPLPASPARLFMRWVTVSLIYAGMWLLHFGLRQDLMEKLHAPMFVTELALLAGVMISAGFSAALLSFPDVHQKARLALAPLLPLSLLIALLFLAWRGDQPPAPQPAHGIECLLCIALFAVLPAGWLLYCLRKQASTHAALAGSAALLAAASAGCLALRLSEQADSALHLIAWHYLPLLGFALLGGWIGAKCFRW